MSLSRHLLALTLILTPVIGCDVEDADDKDVPTPAPAEPTQPKTIHPQPRECRGWRPADTAPHVKTRPSDLTRSSHPAEDSRHLQHEQFPSGPGLD